MYAARKAKERPRHNGLQGDGPRQPQGGPSSKEEEGRGLSLEAEGFREKVGLAQQGERPWALGPPINSLKHSTNRS